jgi:4-amino-4-deoxy-L-arabinose transferase-like glycosyltransferase
VVVFGLADATTTHTYYLVGVAVPLAAVTGAGLSVLWRSFRRGAVTAWLLPAALLGAVLYQIFESRDLVEVWAISIPAAVLVVAIPVMALAIWKKRTVDKPAAACVAAGALSLMVIPLAFALSVGDRIVGPTSALQYSPPPSIIKAREERLAKIPTFIDMQNDAGSVFAIGTVNARDAAPFIINGVPTVAIGGFVGIDPIFTVESFREMAERGELRYFFITSFIGPSPDIRAQDDILRYITATWEDVSRAANLRPGTLFRYPG